MNAYKQALEINRELKRENDKLKERIDKANAIIDNLLEVNEHLQYLHDLKEILNGRH